MEQKLSGISSPTTTTTTTTITTTTSNTPKHSNIREDFARLRHSRTSTSHPNNQQQQHQHHQKQQQQQQLKLSNRPLFDGSDGGDVNDVEDDDDFMMRIVHGSCQRYFLLDDEDFAFPSTNRNNNDNNNGNNMMASKRSLCQNDILQRCQGTFEDHLDLFTHCRQPLSFLSFFHEHDATDSIGVEILPAGAYVMSRHCEYCGSEDTKLCTSACTRPKLFFQKKRPPFEKPNPEKWDPANDHYIPPPQEEVPNKKNDDEKDMRPLSPSIIPSSARAWVAELLDPTPEIVVISK